MKVFSVLLIIVFSLTANIFSQVQFTSHTIVDGEYSVTIPTSVYAVDVDGDGDMDVLSASAIDNKIAWYENTGTVGVESISNEIPGEFSLNQNYPNPFNPSTIIHFSIPEESFVTLMVFNTLGEEITTLINENIIAGNYEVEFYVTALPSGIYFYRLQAVSFFETKKMVFMK